MLLFSLLVIKVQIVRDSVQAASTTREIVVLVKIKHHWKMIKLRISKHANPFFSFFFFGKGGLFWWKWVGKVYQFCKRCIYLFLCWWWRNGVELSWNEGPLLQSTKSWMHYLQVWFSLKNSFGSISNKFDQVRITILTLVFVI